MDFGDAAGETYLRKVSKSELFSFTICFIEELGPVAAVPDAAEAVPITQFEILTSTLLTGATTVQTRDEMGEAREVGAIRSNTPPVMG